MDDYCSEIPWEGGIPPIEDTNYLAEETDELAEASRKTKSKKR